MVEFTIKTSSTSGIIDVEIEANEREARPLIAMVHRATARDGLSRKRWGPGSYILVDANPGEDRKSRVYVGHSTDAGVSARLGDHFSSPLDGIEKWSFAVVLYGQKGEGVDSEIDHKEAKGLEYLLWSKLSGSEAIEVINNRPPSQPGLQMTIWDRLKEYVYPAIELLKVFGCDPDKLATSLVEKNNVKQTLKQDSAQAKKIKKLTGVKNKPSKDFARLIELEVLDVGQELFGRQSHDTLARIVDREGYISVEKYTDMDGNPGDCSGLQRVSMTYALNTIYEAKGIVRDSAWYSWFVEIDNNRISLYDLKRLFLGN